MKFQFMQAHSREYPIALMCRALEVSESGYHAWSKREVSQRAQEDQALADQIAQIFQANRGVYGSGHRLEALFILALATGMRRGELLALKW